MLQIPKEIEEIAQILADAGYEAYLIGGCVRDLLIGRTPKDWDLTTNAHPEQIQALFEETFYENDYGTVGVVTQSDDPRLKVVEITPYRIETGYSNARHPDEVRFSEKLEDDLKRRDFTVNAIAYDPKKKEIIDPHDGRGDIVRQTLVTVGNPEERFAEDALRMLRAIRLSAELDFTIEAQTMLGIQKHAKQLEKISAERIRDEFLKILATPRPMPALYIAQRLGVLHYIIPELEEGIGIQQNQAHAFDVFEHLLRSMQHAADKDWPVDVRLAALLHDIGKPASRDFSKEKGDYTFYGHEVIGAKMAKKILSRLHIPNEMAQKVTTLIRWHMFFSDPDEITLSAVRRLIANVGKDYIWDLLNLRICDRIGTGRPKEQPFRLRKYISMVEEAMRDPITVGMLKIDGKALMEKTGEKPGPKIGWTLHALLEEVFDDPAKNTEEYLTKRAKKLVALPSDELKALGEAGKERKEEEDKAEIAALRKKHHVT